MACHTARGRRSLAAYHWGGGVNTNRQGTRQEYEGNKLDSRLLVKNRARKAVQSIIGRETPAHDLLGPLIFLKCTQEVLHTNHCTKKNQQAGDQIQLQFCFGLHPASPSTATYCSKVWLVSWNIIRYELDR